MATDEPTEAPPVDEDATEEDAEHKTLKYSLLGPSLLKAGQDAVDQEKVCCRLQPRMHADTHLRHPPSSLPIARIPLSASQAVV